MKNKIWSLRKNSLQISVKNITKSLLIVVMNLVIFFVFVTFGQGSWNIGSRRAENACRIEHCRD